MISLLETNNHVRLWTIYIINIPNKYQEHCTLDRRFSSQPSDSLTDRLGGFASTSFVKSCHPEIFTNI